MGSIDLYMSYKSIKKFFKKHSLPIKELRSCYKNLKSHHNPDRMAFCIHRLIAAEIDFATEGNNGIVRFTQVVPRLGAYYRSGFCKLSNDQLFELAYLVKDLILRGYIAGDIYGKYIYLDNKHIDFDYLFSMWINLMYYFYVDNMDPEAEGAIGIFSQSAFDAIEEFLEKNGISREKIFSHINFSTIMHWYPIAGFALRAIEMQECCSKSS